MLETVIKFIKSQHYVDFSNEKVKIDKSRWGNPNIQKPVHVSIELTYHCNYRCKHCYNESTPNYENYHNTDELIKVLDDLYDNGIVVVELTGGEPLSHPDFEIIFEHCLKLFKLVAVLTNGYLITEKLLDSFIEYNNKIMFQVDLHGTEEYMDWFCDKKGAFKQIKNSIKLITERDFILRVVMVVTKLNYKQLIETITIAKNQAFYPSKSIKSKAYSMAISGFVPHGRGKDSTELFFDEKSALSYLKLLPQIKEKFGDFIFELPEEIKNIIKKQSNCGAGTRSLTITPDGDMKICPMADESVIIGNIYKSENILEIFSKNFTTVFINMINPNSKTCIDCEYYNFCDGCLARGIIQYQKIKNKCVWGLKLKLNEKLSKIKNGQTIIL
jgi:radical SAM protein with 4Fe4S-binding SPASM domain